MNRRSQKVKRPPHVEKLQLQQSGTAPDADEVTMHPKNGRVRRKKGAFLESGTAARSKEHAFPNLGTADGLEEQTFRARWALILAAA